MSDPRIEKLPKWAQGHIQKLQRERDTAVQALREWNDHQTETDIWVDELSCVGEFKGPSCMTRYVEGHKISCRAAVSNGAVVHSQPN